jgi:hypothetical protein
MKNNADILWEFLEAKLPDDIEYFDLVQICLGLHCYVNGIPEHIQPCLNKNDQAEAFARFVASHFDDKYGDVYWSCYGARFHRVTEKGHWIEVIASIYKKGGTWDKVREGELRKRYFN